MIKIKLDKVRSELVAMAPTRGDMQRMLRGLAAVARQRWIHHAQTNLKTTARDYVNGIQDVEFQNDKAVITLVGVLPNMVEQGVEAFDLRTTLLGADAKNAKTAKDGSRYNTVPFQHGAAGSSGRNTGAPMPGPIHQIAKKLEPTLSRPEGGTKWGGRLHLGMKMSNAARAILQTKERPWHSSSIYMHMVRKEKRYEKATQSSYTTFRRISSNSRNAKEHWLHPGIQARHFATKVQEEMGDMVKAVFAPSTRGRRR